jgi:hypothetical protein
MLTDGWSEPDVRQVELAVVFRGCPGDLGVVGDPFDAPGVVEDQDVRRDSAHRGLVAEGGVGYEGDGEGREGGGQGGAE